MSGHELLAMQAIPLIVAGAALTLAPVWTQPGTFFGVRVAPGFRLTREARRIWREFAIRVWSFTALAAILAFSAMRAGTPGLISAGILVQLAGSVWAFQRGRRRVMPQRVPAPSVRTALLIAPPLRVPGGTAAIAGPYLLLGAAALAVYLHGNPVRWSLAGLAILGTVSGWIVLILKKARRAPEGSGIWRRNRAVLGSLTLSMWLNAVMFSLVSIAPLISHDGRSPVPAFVMAVVPVAFIIAIIAWLARAYSLADSSIDSTPDDCWIWGMFYSNPNDASILVEKRFGMGYTLNFGHWQSWAILGATLILPVLITLLVKH
jgi:uncharacterized membrane protein